MGVRVIPVELSRRDWKEEGKEGDCLPFSSFQKSFPISKVVMRRKKRRPLSPSNVIKEERSILRLKEGEGGGRRKEERMKGEGRVE